MTTQHVTVVDLERLQGTLDDIASTVEWAVKWLEYLEAEELRFDPDSDRLVLEAEGNRLRVVADAVLPDRVRDPASGRRWYLAPDDARQRADDVESALDAADAEVKRAAQVVEGRRRESEREKAERDQRDQERAELSQRQRAQVAEFLREHGPATAKEIAQATGLSSSTAAFVADTVAKRGRDQRFRLPE